MDKNYLREFNVFEKQQKGETLSPMEMRWKKKFNASRVVDIITKDGVKITRYKPNWEK